MSLTDLVHSNVGLEVEVLAEKALDELPRPELIALIGELVVHERRRVCAAREREMWRELISQSREPGPIAKSDRAGSSGVKGLLVQRFALGDGTSVEWGAATVDQHETRIAMLQRMRDGIDLTIDRHRSAIEAIHEAGVTCLADLQSSEVAA